MGCDIDILAPHMAEQTGAAEGGERWPRDKGPHGNPVLGDVETAWESGSEVAFMDHVAVDFQASYLPRHSRFFPFEVGISG